MVIISAPGSPGIGGISVDDRRVAIIGFGAIGSEVAAGLRVGLAGSVDLAVLLRPDSPRRGSVPDGIRLLRDMQELLAWAPDLTVEAAGHAALAQYGANCLSAGRDLVVSSVGALADDALRERLMTAAKKGRAKLIVPSGAVAGLDYLAAVRGVAGTRVTYVSRKPPAAWADELARLGLRPEDVRHEIELFAGSAAEAALRYPKNLNVAATLALGGIGMDATDVRVVVDPAASGNQHEVIVNGPAGECRISLVNRPSPGNPKTSWVTGLSVTAAIARYFAPLRIG